MNVKVNIAITGGPCTGKSTLAASLFAELKIKGYDFDLIGEECRKLKKELGQFKSPFERFYIWRQQEREERRSSAENGFITDMPLFHCYIQARQYATEPRDDLAVRELHRMCMEIEDRYDLIVIAKDSNEIPFKNDQSRKGSEKQARERHDLIRRFLEDYWPDKLLFIAGSLKSRTKQIVSRFEEILQARISFDEVPF